jgi:hypothetical protein
VALSARPGAAEGEKSNLYATLGRVLRALTVTILGGQHPLQGSARAPPPLVLQVVAGAVGRAVLPRDAIRRPRARIGYHSVQDAERGQREAALFRAQLEPEHKHSGS